MDDAVEPHPIPTLGADDAFDQSLAEVRALADRGEVDEAADRCTQLLEERRLCPKANFHLALLMEQAGRIDEAEQWLRKALYLDRTYVLAYFYRGLWHRQKGEFAAAQRALENVLDLTAQMPAKDDIDGADEMKVSDLRRLTEMQLSLLAES